MSVLAKAALIAWKDLRAEFRTKETLSGMLIFAFLIVVIFGFAFDPSRAALREVMPGIIWVGFFFAAELGLARSFTSEKASDCLLGLMLAPVDRSAIYFGKVASNWILVSIMEAVSLPIFLALYDFHFSGPWWLLVAAVLAATFGFVAAGTFLAALAANSRTSEILLPILLFPIVVPVVIAAVEITRAVFAGGGGEMVGTWFKVLGVYDIVFLTIPFLLFEYVLEV